MKDKVEEMNHIHNEISELRVKINDLQKDIGTGNSTGRETRDSIYEDRMKNLIKEYAVLIARLKKVVE